MNKLLLLYHTFPLFSYGIFNNGIKYVPMGYKEASCPPNIPTKTQTGGGSNYYISSMCKLFVKKTIHSIVQLFGCPISIHET